MRACPFALADEFGIKVMKTMTQVANNLQFYSAAASPIVMLVTNITVSISFWNEVPGGKRATQIS